MVIETDRLILREWEMSDIADVVEGLNDFDTAKNLTVPFPYTEQIAKEHILKCLKREKDRYHFAVQLKVTGKVIGSTSISFKNNRWDGGIWINKNYHSMGFGTEIFIARARFAFYTLGVDALENGYYDFNKKSENLHKKIGYVPVGEGKQFCPALNKEIRVIEARLTQENFEAKLKELENKRKYKFKIVKGEM